MISQFAAEQAESFAKFTMQTLVVIAHDIQATASKSVFKVF